MTDLERAWHPATGNTRLAHSLIQGMSELNALFPGRPQGPQEGTIGDSRHQAEPTSDHNPNAAGVVRAWDIDCTIGVPFDPQKLANTLAAMMQTPDRYNFFGSKGYVIYNRRITSWNPWGVWTPYYGSDPHTQHIHVSVGQLPAEYDDTEPWNLATGLGVTPQPAPVPTPVLPAQPPLEVHGKDRWAGGSSLAPGSVITSANNLHQAAFQLDGNFAVYNNGKAVFASNTNGIAAGGRRLDMQPDGNLVMYNAAGQAPHVLWQTRSNRELGQYVAVMQDDGNFVIYNATTHKPLWWTKH